MGRVALDPGLVKKRGNTQGTGHEVSALCPDRSHASCGRTGSFFGPHPPCHHGRSPWSSDRCHCLEGDSFPKGGNFVIHNGGATLEAYAGTLFHDLRAFDSEGVEISSWEKGCEDQMGLAIMNRLRKSAGHNIIWAEGGLLYHRSGAVPECLRTLVMEGMLKDERTGTWEKALNISKNKQDIPFSLVLSAGSWNIESNMVAVREWTDFFTAFVQKSCKSDV